MNTDKNNAQFTQSSVSVSVDDAPKVIIVGCGNIGLTAAIAHALSKTNNVEIVASIQDVKNQMGNDYFARESLKLKCFDLPLLTELRDKKGKLFELPKSKYHR